MIPRSLSARLLIALVAGQICAIVVAIFLFPLVVPYDSYSDIAEDTFRAKIEAAIERDPSGGLAIVTTHDLQQYVAARPGAAFAVVTLPDGKILRGSDPALGRALAQISPFGPRPPGDLIANYGDNGGTLIVTPEDTALGRFLFGTTGNSFHAVRAPPSTNGPASPSPHTPRASSHARVRNVNPSYNSATPRSAGVSSVRDHICAVASDMAILG